MRHDNFLEILDDLQNITNSEYNTEPGFLGQYKIYYNNKSLYVVRVIEYSTSNNYTGTNLYVEYKNVILYSKKVAGSIFLELSNLINYCKKNLSTNPKRFDCLFEKVREFCDFQDVLECF